MQLDKKWICILIGLLLVCGTVYFVKDWLMFRLTAFFLIKDIELFLGAIATIISLAHKLKFKKIVFKSNMTFGQFKEPAEALTSFISNPISILCSFSILRGLFLQYLKKGIYYPKFNDVEISFLWLIAIYLLFNALTETITEVRETIIYTSGIIENPQPISEQDYRERQS